MKILHLCTYSTGGASNAAYRLHLGLLKQGVDSVFGVKEATAHDKDIHVAVGSGLFRIYANQSPRLEYQYAKWRRPSVRPVLPAYRFPGVCRGLIRKVRPDLINLHWVDHNFVSIEDLQWISEQKIPLVWTLHDMSPATGGFCYREEAGLPRPPYGPFSFLDSRKKVSEQILARRKTALNQAQLLVVSPSRWLAEEARNSPVFENHQVTHIFNGISTDDFFPLNRTEARQRFSLPSDRKIILFGAVGFDHPRKGLQHLKKAVEQIARSHPAHLPLPLLVGFGNNHPVTESDFALPVKALGSLGSLEELRAAYSAADLFICPSREDNLPNTILESLACGTPVLGFRVGGVPDLIEGFQWGGVSPCFDEAHLGQQILHWLSMPPEDYEECRIAARKFACSELSLAIQANRYRKVYETLLEQPR